MTRAPARDRCGPVFLLKSADHPVRTATFPNAGEFFIETDLDATRLGLFSLTAIAGRFHDPGGWQLGFPKRDPNRLNTPQTADATQRRQFQRDIDPLRPQAEAVRVSTKGRRAS